jgi:hypothetical protein
MAEILAKSSKEAGGKRKKLAGRFVAEFYHSGRKRTGDNFL